MAHPYASQSASSASRRLKAVGGKGVSAGKAWGSSAMQVAGRKSYPSKNAGSQVPYFADGGSVGPRPDRMARGGHKGKSKKHATTNITISIPPHDTGVDAAAANPATVGSVPMPMPMPTPRPVPIPVGAGGPPALPPVPPVAPGGPPLMPPGIRPPGMKRGGDVKGTNKAQLGMAVPGRGPVARPVSDAAVAGLANRGVMANKAAVNREAIRDAVTNRAASRMAAANRPAVPPGRRPFKKGGETPAQEAKDSAAHERGESKVEEKKEHMAKGGAVKQGGGGTAQFGEGRGYPVMKHGNSGLGRLEKIKKAPV